MEVIQFSFKEHLLLAVGRNMMQMPRKIDIKKIFILTGIHFCLVFDRKRLNEIKAKSRFLQTTKIQCNNLSSSESLRNFSQLIAFLTNKNEYVSLISCCIFSSSSSTSSIFQLFFYVYWNIFLKGVEELQCLSAQTESPRFNASTQSLNTM